MDFLSKRISVVKSEQELSLVLMSTEAPNKSYLQLFWFLVWTVCGGFMIVHFFNMEASKTKTMYLIWLAFWLYFEYLIGRAWMWRRFGREILKIKNGAFYYKRDTAGRGFVHVYATERIKDMREREDKSPSWMKNMAGNAWNTDCNSLAFDFEDKEINFGYQLSEEEKKSVVSLVRKYVKRKVDAA